MSRTVLTLVVRRQVGRARSVSRLTLGFAIALNASSCLDEVDVPPCVASSSTCANSGAGGQIAEGGAPAGEEHPSGAPSQLAGRGGADSSSEGGSDSGTGTGPGTGGTEGGAEAGADAGGAPGAGGEGGAGDALPACKSCVVRPTALDAPCAGRSYQATLAIAGGEPPFSWQVSPNLEGWSITPVPNSPDQAILYGEKVGPGETTLAVQAIDAAGEYTKRSYTLAARTACWFAYIALGKEGPELRIVDPLAESPEPLPLGNNTNVVDFKFSPDGKHLAYSYESSDSSPQGQHLALVDLETLEDQALIFGEDRITAFAWSPDSTTLAAGFIAEETGYLGAIRLQANGLPAALTATPAFIDGNLEWVGNRFVAYHAPVYELPGQPGVFEPHPDGQRTPFFVELGDTGFAPHGWAHDAFPPDAVMKATPQGFYMLAPGGFPAMFYPLSDDWLPVLHFEISLVSPSGAYSALLEDGLLSILPAADGYFSPVATSAQDACPMPLAWAAGSEQIACLADVLNEDDSAHGELRFFDVKNVGEVLEMSTLADFCEDDVMLLNEASCAHRADQYAYGTQLASSAARGFSASGRWFAFASVREGATFLYTADLADRPIGLHSRAYFNRPGTLRLPTRLAFSPDERSLLFQLGPTLTLHDVASGKLRLLVREPLSTPEKCAEDFTIAPSAYCGNTDEVAPFSWAPDSKAFAYRSPGALTVVLLTSLDGTENYLPAPDCGDACSDRFAFQPQPSP